MTVGSLDVVERWLEAVNERDGAALEALTVEPVEIHGPRGAQFAERAVLSEWLSRSGFTSTTIRWFCGPGGSVVVEQVARWEDVVTGAPQEERTIASQFTVCDGRVARYMRYDGGLQDALPSAGLTEADEVTERGRAVPSEPLPSTCVTRVDLPDIGAAP